MSRQGQTPMVIGPDIILDLVFVRGRAAMDAVMLLDAIAADAAAGVTSRRAYVAPATLSEVYSIVLHEAGLGKARSIVWRLLDVVSVAPAGTSEYRKRRCCRRTTSSRKRCSW